MRRRVIIVAGLVLSPAMAPMVAQADRGHSVPRLTPPRVVPPAEPTPAVASPAGADPSSTPASEPIPAAETTVPEQAPQSTEPTPAPPTSTVDGPQEAPATTAPDSTTTTTTTTTTTAPDSTTTTTTPIMPESATTTTLVPGPGAATTGPETSTTAPSTPTTADPVPATTTTPSTPGATPTEITRGDGGTVADEGAAKPEHLQASAFDEVYANGLPLGTAMATTRFLESGNDYSARAAKASASGAYQIIDRFWNNYGGYPRAYLAPPDVQDQFAYEHFVQILKNNGNNLAAIPVAWYYPAALRNSALMDIVPVPEAGNRLTIREYQTRWLTTFFELLEQGSPPFLPDDVDPLVPSIAFPVLGPVRFAHDFGAPRGEHGERFHEGLDLIGVANQPLRAAFDGVVTRIRIDPSGISGVVLTITRSDGLRANYFHLNNDTPGTDDNIGVEGLRVHPGIKVGDTVKAGQIVAYMGNTGNAVNVPHLHFELRTPEGVPMNPYPAVVAAQQREQCSVGIGPWSTDFFSPDEEEKFHTDFALLPVEQQDALKWMAAATPVPAVYMIALGPDGARWEIDEAGHVRAIGVAAVIQPSEGSCETLPATDVIYGTDASGVGRDLLPTDWWDAGVAYSGPVVDDDLNGGDGSPAAPSGSASMILPGELGNETTPH